MLEKKLKQEGPEGDTNTAPSDGQQVAGEGDITLVQDGEATPDKVEPTHAPGRPWLQHQAAHD